MYMCAILFLHMHATCNGLIVLACSYLFLKSSKVFLYMIVFIRLNKCTLTNRIYILPLNILHEYLNVEEYLILMLCL